MSIAISDALQQAQQAIEGGDYRSAIETCNGLVNQFPDYAAAYRVLGEAYLEQGQTADAEQAFAQALARDPRQPWAYHGLGLIAEEQNVLDNALAFCQVAWELAPNYAQLRDPVIRIATRRFGADGQAQLTSAALAQIYANTARLQRAATEYRGALADLPDRVDLKLGLAETLWLLGQNDESADLCRQVLEENPVAIQALIILSDIEGRGGNSAEAADLRGRIRAIDPDGAIAATMLARNKHADHASLLIAADAVPVLDDTAEAVVAERPHIAPAPDFSYQPARAEQPAQDIEDLEPISAEEFGDVAAEMEPEDEVTAEFDTVGSVETFQDDAPSIYRDEQDDDLSAIEQELTASEPSMEAGATEAEAEATADDDLDALMAEFGDVEPMGIEEFGAEPDDLERLAAAESDLLSGDDDDMFGDLSSPFPSEGGADEHVRNLASALEDDVAGVLDRTGEFQTVGSQLEHEVETEQVAEVEAEEQPAESDPMSGTGYTTVLHELDDEGLTPFDPMGRPEMQEPSAPTYDTEGATGEESGHSASVDDIAKLTEDWDSIDDEIARAVPITTGQTDQLRAADDLGIAPFDFETEDDTSRLPAYRPFGEDDDELPEIDAEAETEDAETEAKEIAEDVEFGDMETFVAEPEPEQEQEDVPVATADEDLLGNLEPFSLEEFEEADEGDKPFSFGSLPWETGATGSAVPSDEDLDLLLSPDNEATQPGEETETPSTEPDWPARTLEASDAQAQDPEPVDWTTAIQDQEDAAAEADTSDDDAHSTWDVPSDWDASLAVTRQIGREQDNFAERLAEA
ncbi:MAG TPA: tetratricopeptide repeat protein, partial [Thermomicrobiales bacterium]|nr:tetratricopeptide repeat protein [Thermomicrobiales bacterium]